MMRRKCERNPADSRSLTEALGRAVEDSGVTRDTLAEQLGVRRGYLSDALNPDREELQFQARHIVPLCRIVGAFPLEWMADQLGFVLVPRETAHGANTLVLEVLDVQAAAGHLAEKVRAYALDGRLDKHELIDVVDASRRAQREAAEVERAAVAMAGPQSAGRVS